MVGCSFETVSCQNCKALYNHSCRDLGYKGENS